MVRLSVIAVLAAITTSAMAITDAETLVLLQKEYATVKAENEALLVKQQSLQADYQKFKKNRNVFIGTTAVGTAATATTFGLAMNKKKKTVAEEKSLTDLNTEIDALKLKNLQKAYIDWPKPNLSGKSLDELNAIKDDFSKFASLPEAEELGKKIDEAIVNKEKEIAEKKTVEETKKLNDEYTAWLKKVENKFNANTSVADLEVIKTRLTPFLSIKAAQDYEKELDKAIGVKKQKVLEESKQEIDKIYADLKKFIEDNLSVTDVKEKYFEASSKEVRDQVVAKWRNEGYHLTSGKTKLLIRGDKEVGLQLITSGANQAYADRIDAKAREILAFVSSPNGQLEKFFPITDDVILANIMADHIPVGVEGVVTTQNNQKGILIKIDQSTIDARVIRNFEQWRLVNPILQSSSVTDLEGVQTRFTQKFGAYNLAPIVEYKEKLESVIEEKTNTQTTLVEKNKKEAEKVVPKINKFIAKEKAGKEKEFKVSNSAVADLVTSQITSPDAEVSRHAKANGKVYIKVKKKNSTVMSTNTGGNLATNTLRPYE